MNWPIKLQHQFAALFRKQKMDAEMDAEMRSHIDLQTQANIDSGMAPEEARRAAFRQFGWVESIKEACREQREGLFAHHISLLAQDLRYGARILRKNPGFAAVVVLLLAIGIGASTTMFSVVDAVFLRACPYKDSESLVSIYAAKSGEIEYRDPLFSGPTFRDWRDHNEAFARVVAWISYECRLNTAESLERVRALSTSPGMFSLLGVQPVLGRTFLPEDAQPGGERVVMLSYGHWQRWFHGDPGVIGKTVKLDSDISSGRKAIFTVVGVLPATFHWVFDRFAVPGLWFPLRESDETEPTSQVWVMARLRPGITLAQAQAEMDVASHHLAQAYPETNAGRMARVVPINAEPLLGVIKVNLSRSLAGGHTTSGGVGVRRGLGCFVVSEVAIACVLLVGTGLLLNSAMRLQINPGFNPRNVLQAGVLLRDQRYANADAQKRFFREALDRIRSVPGVLYADIGGPTPVGGGGGNPPTRIEGDDSGEEHKDIRFLSASPDCFRALQVPLPQGRFFTDRDDETAPPVLIINEAMARRYWPDAVPIGRHVMVQRSKTNHVSFEVVGVVGNVYNYSSGTTSPPEAFTSWLQHGVNNEEDVVIRTATDAGPMKAVLQRAIKGVHEDVEIYNACTLEEGISRHTWSWSRRFNTLFLGGFAAIAFLLASIGVYGVTAYSVSQRTHEIGIRMALGARRENVLALVLRHGMILAGVGMGIGLAGALALTRVVRTLLFGITPTDPLTFGLTTVVVAVVAFAACWSPARRAAQLDPMVALRHE